MIKVKGTTVYPLAITNILDGIDGLDDYVITLEDDEACRTAFRSTSLLRRQSGENFRPDQGRTACLLPVLVTNLATLQHMRGKSAKKTRIIDNRKHGAALSPRPPV